MARLAGVRCIVRTRNNLGYWVTPVHRWLGWLCNLWTDMILTNCAACREAIIHDEGVSPRRVRVLENGVDLSRFPPLHPARQSPNGSTVPARVGIVANLRPIKNLDLFIRAAALVAPEFPHATFHIAGTGELGQELDSLARALGLEDRCVLHGPVADIPAFLAGLDVAVLCSRSEGMSNALLEYMAAGKAIVATAVGANVQLLKNNVNGLLVPVGDPVRLAGALRRLLRDPALGRRLGTAARQKVEQFYSREAMVRRFEAFYRELIQTSRGASCSTY